MSIITALIEAKRADERRQDSDRRLKHPVKRAREAARMSQDALADALRSRGVNATQDIVCRWETGSRVPTHETAEVIGEILGLSVDDVRSGRPPLVVSELVETQLAMMPATPPPHGRVLAWVIFRCHWIFLGRGMSHSEPVYIFDRRSLPTRAELEREAPALLRARKRCIDAAVTITERDKRRDD